MTAVIALLIGLVVGAIVAGLLVASLAKKKGNAATQAVEAEAQKILDAARAEAEAIKKEAQVKGKEAAFKIKSEVEAEVRRKKAEVAKAEEAANHREEELKKKEKQARRREEELARKEKNIGQRERAAESMGEKAQKKLEEAKAKLEEVAGMSAGEAKQRLIDQIAGEAREVAAAEIRKIEQETEAEATEKAKKIIATAIQRYAGEYVGERTVSVVPLPSDDMKGRLIGREGRNVRALEAATGTDLIIDDTPECITISCFNPVRREVARLAVGRLVADGRIHPTRIEEVVHKCEKEVDTACKEAGEQAIFDLGLHRVHPEIVKTLGSLKYRASYAQNLLAHSIEVGFLAGVMAEELGLNVKMARRAGLFHDIGKALDHEHDGPHAVAGAEFLRKRGESPKVCQAVAAHHGDVGYKAVLDHVVDAANRLSGQRPGARREQLAGFVKRLEDIETLARTFDGVSRAFAIQAGRELRVIVDNAKITDEQAVMISRDLAKKIEDEMTYAGQVRVCVVRETRASEYAK